MAIAKMSKLRLIAMSEEKSLVLDALERTGSVQVVSSSESVSAQTTELCERLSAVESCLDVLVSEKEEYNGEHKIDEKADAPVSVDYSAFLAIAQKQAFLEEKTKEVSALMAERNVLLGKVAKERRARDQAIVYEKVPRPFSEYTDTRRACVKLGVVPLASLETMKGELEEEPLADLDVISSDGSVYVVNLVCHKSVENECTSILTANGFMTCPYTDKLTGSAFVAEIDLRIQNLLEEEKALEGRILEMGDVLPELKIYYDYLAFQAEKSAAFDGMNKTATTFFLEGYVPEEETDRVRRTLESVSSAIYVEFGDPSEDEATPTLLKNNSLVKSFEGVTNTYSAPNYHEIDPNPVMAIFYSIFLGLIIGDIGYGLLMAIGGMLIRLKSKDKTSGLCSMATVFAVGGVCAVVVGTLFNSFFGFPIFGAGLIESMPILYDLKAGVFSSWSFAGIMIPSMLIVMLLVGVVQLGAGYVMKAVQCAHYGDYLGMICEGFSWAIFSVGFFLICLGFVAEFALPEIVLYLGLGFALFGLFLAILGAVLKSKGFGKFTKAFGTVYGLINYASDVLSYARLYGLLLSGAVIAQISTNYALDFIGMGGAFVVVGILLALVGHGLNLAISLLGAYIHDARLQYVEFYGKFFEGEGELFVPFGSRRKYVNFIR